MTKELVITCREFDAVEAKASGFLNRICGEEELAATRDNVLRMTGGAPETIHLDLIELAFGSPARLAVAPMQDFLGLGSDARINIPGTTLDNWRWRFLAKQLSPRFQAGVAALVDAAGRG